MADVTNPFAPLLAGVRRINPYSQETSALLYEDEVLAALAATVQDDLADMDPIDRSDIDRLVLALRKAHGADISNKAADLITSLAEEAASSRIRIGAQEATIKGLEAERRRAVNEAETLRHYRASHIEADARAEVAETALAAERAKTAKLVEALKRVLEPLDEPCRHDHHGYCQAHFIEADCSVAALRAAIVEASQ